MLRLTKFMKFEAEIVVARDSFDSSAIYLHPDFAKKYGIKEGDVVSVEAKRAVKLKVKLSNSAPENGGIIPNSIFASFLTDFENFKRFKARIEVTDEKESTIEEIIEALKSNKK